MSDYTPRRCFAANANHVAVNTGPAAQELRSMLALGRFLLAQSE